MAYKANVVLTFVEYEVRDDGTVLTFLAADPGPEQESFIPCFLTNEELATVTTGLQLRNLLQTKLNRRIRASGIASKLDPFIGQSLTVA